MELADWKELVGPAEGPDSAHARMLLAKVCGQVPHRMQKGCGPDPVSAAASAAATAAAAREHVAVEEFRTALTRRQAPIAPPSGGPQPKAPPELWA